MVRPLLRLGYTYIFYQVTLQIRGLKALHSTLSFTLQSQRTRRASSRRAKTLKGRLSSLIGRFFAGYCIFRIFTAGYSIVFFQSREQQSQTYPDIVTSLLVWLLLPSSGGARQLRGLVLTPELISSLSRHVSLLLVGLIVVSSIGHVMRGVNRVS